MGDRNGTIGGRLEIGSGCADVPRPRVPKPHRRQHVERVGVRPGVGGPHDHDQVGGVGLDVVDLDDPIAVAVEGAGVEQLVLGIELATTTVLRDQRVVGERRLRVVVAPSVPRVARHGVEVPPVLLDVLPVVGLGAGEPEHPLLEDRISTVPQRQPEAQPLLDVTEAGHPVLAPAVGARAGVIVGERVPCLAIGAVVLAHRAPLALAEVRAPHVPLVGIEQPVGKLPEALDALALGAGHGSRLRTDRIHDHRIAIVHLLLVHTPPWTPRSMRMMSDPTCECGRSSPGSDEPTGQRQTLRRGRGGRARASA